MSTLAARDTARKLNLSLDLFYRNRRRMEARFGFPPPLPGIRPMRWSVERLDAWINGAPVDEPPADARKRAVELDHRAAQIGAGRNT